MNITELAELDKDEVLIFLEVLENYVYSNQNKCQFMHALIDWERG